MAQAPRQLTTDALETLLHERSEMSARPRLTPREVMARWLDNLGAGVGVGVVVAVPLVVFGAVDAATVAAPAAGLLTFAVLMAWRGSQDERDEWRNPRAVRRIVSAMRAEYESQAKIMHVKLEAAFDEIEALERSLDRMTHDRDVAVSELTRERLAAQSSGRSTFVAPVEVTPQEVSDATEMTRWRYQFNRHLSRRVAEDTKQWSQPRWEAAKTVLEDAGVIVITNGVTTYPPTLDEAMQRLGSYLLQARAMSVPAINKVVGYALYVEQE